MAALAQGSRCAFDRNQALSRPSLKGHQFPGVSLICVDVWRTSKDLEGTTARTLRAHDKTHNMRA